MNAPLKRLVDAVIDSRFKIDIAVGIAGGILCFIYLWFASQTPHLGLFCYQAIIAGFAAKSLAKPILNAAYQPKTSDVFTAVALLALFWLPLGFDVTDEGRRLSIAYFLFSSEGLSFVDFKFGSSLLNYVWLHLIPMPSLLWSRLGFVLIQAGIAATSFHLLSQHFSRRLVFVMIIAASAMSLTYVVQSINYNNAPILFALAGFALLFSGNKSTSATFLSGVLLATAALSKITLLALAPAAVAYIFIKDGINKTILLSTGILLVATLFVGFLSSLGQLDSYGTLVSEFIVEPFVGGEVESKNLEVHKHDPDTLSRLYSKNFNYLLERTWPVAIAIILLLIMVASGNYWLWVLSVIGIVAYWNSVFSDDFYYYHYLGVLLVSMLLGSINGLKQKHLPILGASIILALISFAGSNTGVRNIITSGAVILPLGFGLSMLSTGRLKRTGLVTASIIAIAVFIISLNYKGEAIYRDAPRSELTSNFTSAPLLGLFSTESRVTVTDELLAFCKDQNLEGTMLCINTIPMFNYLIDMSPKSIFYWRLPNRSVDEKMEFFNSAESPEFILTSKVNVRNRAWPNVSEASNEADEIYLNFYQEMLIAPDSPYEKIFENQAFALYKKG